MNDFDTDKVYSVEFTHDERDAIVSALENERDIASDNEIVAVSERSYQAASHYAGIVNSNNHLIAMFGRQARI